MTKIPPWNQLMLSGVDRPIVGRNQTNFTQYLSTGRAGRVEEQPRSQVLSLSLALSHSVGTERTLGRRLVEEKGI